MPGGYPASPEFWFAFEVLTPGVTSGTYTVVQSSGWVASNGNTWTVPKALTWGATYYWQVAVSDAGHAAEPVEHVAHLDDTDLVRGGRRPAGRLAPVRAPWRRPTTATR